MSESSITFVNTVLVPGGLIAIMFSLGLTLTLADFSRLLERPRAIVAGLSGQFLALPLLGLLIAALFRLPPDMAMGLFILAVSPAGVTSNAVTFAARGNVALAVTLTTITSMVTVITTPLLIAWALGFYFGGGDAPTLSVSRTMLQLFQMTVLPIGVGMLLRRFAPDLAARLVVWLRPTSIVILVAVILFSVLISAELVLANLIHAGPAAWLLNIAAMAMGVVIARLFRLDDTDSMTIGIEVGIQNATMATFLSLSVLNSWALAITPTIYGILMIMNAGFLVRFFRWKARRKSA